MSLWAVTDHVTCIHGVTGPRWCTVPPTLVPTGGIQPLNAVIDVQVDEALFHSARAAVRFAVTRHGSPPRPMMSKMVGSSIGPSRGLSGLDGAAQAGMIMNVVRRLGELYKSVLVASTAPMTLPCTCMRPCCSGKLINFEWHDAIEYLAWASVKAVPGVTEPELRTALIARHFGKQSTHRGLATKFDFSVSHVAQAQKQINYWFDGIKREGLEIEGIEPKAWNKAEIALREEGIVG